MANFNNEFTIKAISPIDGRYASKINKELSNINSEYGLIKKRLFVEIEWFIFLTSLPSIKKKFPLTNIINVVPEKNSLFETVIVSANDELVNLYLNKKISFMGLQKFLQNFIKLKEFTKLKNKKPKNISEIYDLNGYVRLKIKKLCI